MTSAPITVTHRPEASRFEAIVNGQRAMAEYERRGDVVAMTHTEVPPALEGQGIAAQLVATALGWIREEGLKVQPLCSYVRGYVQRHPEWQDLVAS